MAGNDRVRFWAGKGVATVSDQGLVSGSNFVLGVVLARVLGPEGYGYYVLAFPVFLLAAQLHQAIILDPMGTLQPAYFPGRQREYVASLIRLHILVSLLMMSIAAAGAWWIGRVHAAQGDALAGLLPSIPAVLLFWLCRSGTYLSVEPGIAAKASLLYAAAMAAGLGVGAWMGWLSPFSAFCLMSGASVIACIQLLLRMRPPVFSAQLNHWEIWMHQWRYGRWLLGVLTVGWIQNTCLVFLTGAMLGPRDAGVLIALTSLMLPVNHVMMAAARLLLPHVAGVLAGEGSEAFESRISKLSIMSACAGIGYWLLVSLLSYPLMSLLFGQQYVDYAWLLPWFMVSIALSGAAFPYDLALKALRAPGRQFTVNTVAAAVAITTGLIAVPKSGLAGVIAANVLKDVVILFLLRTYYVASCNQTRSATGDAGALAAG